MREVYTASEEVAKTLFGDYCDPKYENWDNISLKQFALAVLEYLDSK